MRAHRPRNGLGLAAVGLAVALVWFVRTEPTEPPTAIPPSELAVRVQPDPVAAATPPPAAPIRALVVAPAEPPARAIHQSRISGTVIDPNGAPIPGAEVRVSEADIAFFWGGVNARRQTDGGGRFVVADLPDRALRVTAAASGFLTRSLARIDPSSPLDLEIVMRPGPTLAGQVLDAATGDAIRAFAVAIREVEPLPGPDLGDSLLPHESPLPYASSVAALSIAHADGRFEFPGLDLGDYVVDIAAPGYSTTRSGRVRVRAGHSLPAIAIRLPHARVLSGIVVDATNGQAVEGARIQLCASSPAALNRPLVSFDDAKARFHDAIASATSDATGAFRFDSVGPGSWRVTVGCAGFETSFRDVSGFDGVMQRIELTRFSTLTGTVVGVPAWQWYRVKVVAYGGVGRQQRALLDAEGRYTLRNLPAGDWIVRAFIGNSNDYVRTVIRPTTAPSGAPVAADVRLSPGAHRELTLTVDSRLAPRR